MHLPRTSIRPYHQLRIAGVKGDFATGICSRYNAQQRTGDVPVALKVLFYTLSAMFVVGMAGCVIVIPITAYRLFSVLFQRDDTDEELRDSRRSGSTSSP
jgi:hypothetical protein